MFKQFNRCAPFKPFIGKRRDRGSFTKQPFKSAPFVFGKREARLVNVEATGAAYPKPCWEGILKDRRCDCPIRKSNITVISFSYMSVSLEAKAGSLRLRAKG
jgi:hypothetical protein